MQDGVELSVVIPTFNGSHTVAALVDEIFAVFARHRINVVLVNDGSADDTENVCRQILHRYPANVTFVQLTKNFGEHNAVLAGLSQTSGQFVGILDDDGQNPPAELLRLWTRIRETGDDVIYGRYRQKQHHWLRNLGSRLNGIVSSVLMGKSGGLYLSSFKVLSRGLVREVIKFQGPSLSLDGLIWRATNRISQLDVEHRPREFGRSGYTFRKLVRLALDLWLGYSIVPLRLVFWCGLLLVLFGASLASMAVFHSGTSTGTWLGANVLLVGLITLCGVQLAALGIVGEYLGRLFLHQSGAPAFVVRYVKTGGSVDD